EQTQDVKEPEAKGVLTRDGKHVIPYEVLEAERSGKQRAEQEAVINLLSLPTGVRINGIQLISKGGLGGTATVSVKSGKHELIG
ncbi:hypothetical protein Q2U91_27040, partial [Escherichia coli]|nr:hypothetical protein [Escherichia coli]